MEGKYERASLEIINDIFYVKGLSNRGRITLIRQYAEILCRILVNEKKHLYLGKFEKILEKKLPNACFKEELLIHVNNIKDLGNAATHLDINLAEVNDSDKDSAIKSLDFLISYLFINHFMKYRFGTNEDSMTILSLLPPFIRVNILSHLYENDPDNIAIMYKLPLAILKSEGFEKAIEWIEKNKSILESKEWGFRNMYEFNLDKIHTLNDNLNGFSPLYTSFEEALGFYDDKIKVYRDIDSDDVKELIKLTDFIYNGRIPEECDISKMDEYLIHRIFY